MVAKKRKRPNRSAAERREQYDRAHAKVAQTLIKGLMALEHRGCRRTKLGDALLLLLSTQQAQADHGAEDPMLYAVSQPWPWQWQWPQADVPGPEGPTWHPEQVPLGVPVQANTSTPPVAAPTRRALGPAAEYLESNWSFSCTSVAPDGRFSHRSSTSSHENTAAPTPAAHSSLAPLGKAAGVADREEAEATTTALAASAAVQPVSLSTTSPPLATAATKSPAPGKAEDVRARAEATTTAPTSLVAVQQVSPSTLPSPLADDWTILTTNFGKWPTAAEASRYQELILEQQHPGYEVLLKVVAEHEETLRRREARAARRQGQGQAQRQPDADRPEQRSAGKGAG